MPVSTSTGTRLIPCRIDRSRRVRRIYLQMDSPEYVTLKLPMRGSESAGLRLVQEHADWICEMLDAPPALTTLRQYLARHPRLAIAGYWHSVQLQFSPDSPGYAVDDGKRVIRIALDRAGSIDSEFKIRLREIAREYLPKRVRFLEPRVGVKAHGITIRDQKSRWGSCSETSGLSLNWRLILVAPRLQDHVLLHELAHIRHFDHSKDFHGFLASLDPRSKENEKRLHEIAHTVFPLGR